MSDDVKNYVWEHYCEAGGSKKLLLLALAEDSDSEGRCYSGMERLEARVCVSERQLRKLLRELETEGELLTAPNAGIATATGKTNFYVLRMGRDLATCLALLPSSDLENIKGRNCATSLKGGTARPPLQRKGGTARPPSTRKGGTARPPNPPPSIGSVTNQKEEEGAGARVAALNTIAEHPLVKAWYAGVPEAFRNDVRLAVSWDEVRQLEACTTPSPLPAEVRALAALKWADKTRSPGKPYTFKFLVADFPQYRWSKANKRGVAPKPSSSPLAIRKPTLEDIQNNGAYFTNYARARSLAKGGS